MLSAPLPRRRRERRQQSLRHEYEQFILQRIEEFKQQLSREQLLAIADEAVRELEVGPDEQLVLTEVLVLEHVDRLIMHRLNLPTFRRWRGRHLRLRKAQREPTHWGIAADSPVAELAYELQGEGDALVVGAAAAPVSYFLAAHDWPVVFIDQELATVESVETRAAAEALAARFEALVVSLGGWFPDTTPVLAVLDPVLLGRMGAAEREQFMDALTLQTISGGVHFVLPTAPAPGVITLAPDTLMPHYEGWHVERGRADDGARWLLAVKR